MKLAVNAVSLAPGGGLAVLLGYLKAWQEMGSKFEITVYASRRAVIEALEESRCGARIEPFAFEKSSGYHFLLQQLALGKRIESDGANVVWTTPCLVGRCRVPQVVHHQNVLQFMYSNPLPRLARLSWHEAAEAVKDSFTRRTLRESKCNVFVSSYLRKQAERLAPESAPYNHVIYNGVSEEVVDAAASAGADWQGQPHLVAIQSPAAHKDNPTLLRTLAKLVMREPDVAWRLTVAGNGGLSSLQKLADQLGVGDRVDFPGYLSHDELNPVLRRSLCLVYPSLVEAFGLPPIEAMARGCPPVACNVTALPEIVDGAGILVEPARPDQFAEAVLRIYHDTTVRQSLVQRGLERVQQFRWSESAARLAALLTNQAA